jgi:hypothetical protein
MKTMSARKQQANRKLERTLFIALWIIVAVILIVCVLFQHKKTEVSATLAKEAHHAAVTLSESGTKFCGFSDDRAS